MTKYASGRYTFYDRSGSMVACVFLGDVSAQLTVYFAGSKPLIRVMTRERGCEYVACCERNYTTHSLTVAADQSPLESLASPGNNARAFREAIDPVSKNDT